jgi:hypothetical protein
MKKTLQLINTVLEDLRQCGLEIPSNVTARRLLEHQCEEEFIDESGEPRKDIVGTVMYFMTQEGDMEQDSVPVGSRGCDADYECIYGDGDYAQLVETFACLAGRTSEISRLRDWVDVPRGEVFLKFDYKGKEHYFRPQACHDWADSDVLLAVMELFARRGHSYCLLPYGQPGVYYFLKNAVIKRIRKLDPKIEL